MDFKKASLMSFSNSCFSTFQKSVILHIGRAEPSGRHGCRLTRVGLLKTKKSLELLSEMSECQEILHGAYQK